MTEPGRQLIVVGAGAAGLYTALCASRAGAGVTLVSATPLAGASSYFFAKHYAGSRSRRAFAAAHQTLAYLRL